MKALLWDMNGVLIDDEPLQEAAWAAVFKEQGIELEEGWFRARFLGRRAPTAIADHFPDWSEERLRELIEAKRHHYSKLCNDQPPYGPGALSLLLEAQRRHLRQGLVTGAGRAPVERVLRHLPLESWFDVVICGEDVTEGKPDPQGYLLAAARLGIEPADCWAIEDSMPGIEAAHGAGMRCVALTTTFSGAELDHAELVVDELGAALLDRLA